MTITTKNSMYVITPAKNKFLIRKIRALSQSDYITVGEERTSRYITIEVGVPARFEGWHTSIVTLVEV